MRRHSPYNYAFNNPIRFIDPDGMMAISADGLTNEQWIEASQPGAEFNTGAEFRRQNREKERNEREKDPSKDKDVIEYKNNSMTITHNSIQIEILGKLTQLGQLKSVMGQVLEEWLKCCGQYVEPDEEARRIADLDNAFTALGVTVTTVAPQVKVAAGIISSRYMLENIYLDFKNKMILEARIEKKFPGYFDPSSGYNRHRYGGGGSGSSF